MFLGDVGSVLTGSARSSWNRVTVDQITAELYSTWSGAQNIVVKVSITKQTVQYRSRRQLHVDHITVERGLAAKPVLVLTFKTTISAKTSSAVTQKNVTKLVDDAFNTGSKKYVAALKATGVRLLSRVSEVVTSTASAAVTTTSSTTTTSSPMSSASKGAAKKKKKKKKEAKSKTDKKTAKMDPPLKTKTAKARSGSTTASSSSVAQVGNQPTKTTHQMHVRNPRPV
jgi:hypothetical protein